MNDPDKAKPGSKIFVCSMGELFGDQPEWTEKVMNYITCHQDKIFQLLTKRAENLKGWSFPPNAWVGVSVTSSIDAIVRIPKLKDIIAPVKFISFEPLLKPVASPNQLYIMLKLSGINWVIIGCETDQGKPVKAHLPKIEWIKEIVDAAEQAGIPVFLKNNLAGLLPHEPPFWGKTVVKQNMGDMYSPTGMVFSVTKTETTNGLRQELSEVK
jgi:protein gp37